ncbi:MAG TPA: MFS transporter [Ktedonobacteraceae bacterium]|nr:MFS transporter [Ktedonobacteraceae bacterium]
MIAKLTHARFHYGWIIAAITFLSLLTAAGMRSTPGVLIVPLEHEFGWNTATVSLAVSINLFVYGLCGPFSAALMERFGIRRVMVLALLLVALAASLTTMMQAPWQLDLLWGVLVGLASGSLASVLAAIVANRWFVERRGLVMGLLTASNATGQLVFLPLLASLTVTAGWRAAAWAVAGAALLIAPLVGWLMRDRPADVGLRPYGAKPDEKETVIASINPLKSALGGLARGLRSRDFWLLAGSFYICGATTNGLIGTHLIPASMEHGIPEVTAASMLALIGVFDLIGTTASGWLSDRIDNRWLLCWYYGLRGLSLLFLPYALGTSYLTLAVFVVFYGLDWVATVPPTTRLTADIFGKGNVGIVFGWIFAAHQLGAATAAFGAGVLRTELGSYQVSFLLAGVLCLLAAGMVIRIGKAPRETPTIAPAFETDIAGVSQASGS